MFFRKKRAAKKAARAEHRQHILADIDERLAEAQGLQDPGEKILKLKKLEDDIEQSSKEIGGNADTAAFMRGFGAFGITFGPSLVGCIWLAATLSNPWFMALMIPGIWGASKFTAWQHDRLEDRLREENEDFYKGISERTQTVRNLSDTLINNDWPAIAQSPKAQQVLNDIPRLREKYAAAFVNGVKDGGISTPAPAVNDHDALNDVVVQKPIGIGHSLRFKKSAAPGGNR